MPTEPVPLHLSPSIDNYVYGDTPSVPNYTHGVLNENDTITTLNYRYTGITNSDVSYDSATPPTAAGSYSVSVDSITIMNGTTDNTLNYYFTSDFYSFIVSRKEIYIKAVVQDYLQGTSSTPIPLVSDLKTGDTLSSPTYSFSGLNYSSSVMPDFPGTYSVSMSSFKIMNETENTSNYTVTSLSSEFKITQQPLYVVPRMDNFKAGTTPPTPSYIKIGTYNGEITDYLYNGVSTPPTNPGTYDITINPGMESIIPITTSFQVLPMSKIPLYTKVIIADYPTGSPSTPTPIHTALDDGHEIVSYNYTYTSNGNTYTSLPSIIGTFVVTCFPTIKYGVNDVTSSYTITSIPTSFQVLQIPLTITAVTADYPIGKPSTPSFTVTENEDRVSVTFTYQENMPSVSATYEQRIETFEIKDKDGNDVLYKYNVTLTPTTFKVKVPVLITYKVNNYEYGTIGTAYSEVLGYDGPITHEYKCGTSNDLPNKVGTYTISGIATIPSDMYHITYKKTSFRVLPRKIIVKPIVTGTTVTPELIGELRDGDTAEYLFRYGTSETPVSGRNRVTVRAIIRRGGELVTSNYTILCHTAIINI